jgi:hypothetical protein
MPLTQLARDQFLTYGFTTTSLSPARPTTWYLGAFSAYPTDVGGTFSNELSGSGYARQSVTTSLTGHLVTSTNSQVFTSSGTWTSATYVGVFDALTAGNLWAYQECSQSGATYFLAAANISNPGSGYAATNTITLTGGAVVTVDAVATVNAVAGVITQYHVSTPGSYASPAVGPIAQTATSGSGSGATFLGSFLAAPQSFQLNNGDTWTFATGALNISLS